MAETAKKTAKKAAPKKAAPKKSPIQVLTEAIETARKAGLTVKASVAWTEDDTVKEKSF